MTPDSCAMPTPAGSIRLVCFDLGGVLIRICRTWAEGCRVAGVPHRTPEAGADDPIAGIADLHRRHQMGEIDVSTFARLCSDRLDGLYAAQEILAVHRAWILGEYDGIAVNVEQVHRHQVATAALSNTNEEHWRRMPEFASFGLIEHALASHELGMVKPEPQIYRHLEERLGVAGAQILFFDDLTANVTAARHRGWNAVLIDPEQETAPQVGAALREHGVVA